MAVGLIVAGSEIDYTLLDNTYDLELYQDINNNCVAITVYCLSDVFEHRCNPRKILSAIFEYFKTKVSLSVLLCVMRQEYVICMQPLNYAENSLLSLFSIVKPVRTSSFTQVCHHVSVC